MYKKTLPSSSLLIPSLMLAQLVFLFFTVCIASLTDCYAALPQTPNRYQKAKDALETLIKSPEQAKYRTSWLKLYKEFTAIHNDDPAWSNRPAALFRAAECLEYLAKYSYSTTDSKKAAETYEKVANNYKKSSLADDALYKAAKIYASMLKDETKALELLGEIGQKYPKSDMANDAKALEKNLREAQGANESIQTQAPKQAKERKTKNSVSEEDDAYAKKLSEIQKRMKILQHDAKRSCWRQPWETLESELLALHKKAKDKKIGAEALFYAAQARANLATCSRSLKDYRGAQELYQSLPQYFSKSPLADDALFESAQISHLKLNDTKLSRRLLTDILRKYPKGNCATAARTMLSQITKQSPQKQGVQLQLLSWDSIDKNRVQITLELTGKIQYQAKLTADPNKKQKHLYLDLMNTEIAESIRKGVHIKGSLLEGIFVEKHTKAASLLRFDVREAKRFDISVKPDSTDLVVTIDARKNVAPKNAQNGQNYVASFSSNNESIAIKKVKNQDAAEPFSLARQLGLSVQTVFIDAGHGGKDPGTYHNNIVEKFVAMDVARTLGRLLENNGLQVLYSRTTDKFIPLTQRTAMANAAGADLFISIHVNASPRPEANGFETYFLSLARTPDAVRLASYENIGSDRKMRDMQRVLTQIMLTAKIDESKCLARDIQRVTVSRLNRASQQTKNNGTKSAPFHVLVGAKMPAVLVEVGYCSNLKEARKLASFRYRELLAQGLAEGVMAYRERLSEKKPVLNAQTRKKSGTM